VSQSELPHLRRRDYNPTLGWLLVDADFDHWVEDGCQPYYATTETQGVRGYYEGIGSQREIALAVCRASSRRGISLHRAESELARSVTPVAASDASAVGSVPETLPVRAATGSC